MFRNLRYLRSRSIISCIRRLSDKKEPKVLEKDNDIHLGNIATKYRPFKDEDSKIIFDIYDDIKQEDEVVTEYDPMEGINLESYCVCYKWRKHCNLFTKCCVLGGINGVYEIDELLEVLRRDNAQEIFVANVPPDVKYVDYICIVTGKSYRHMQAIAEFVRKVYKKKRHSYDPIPILEGKESRDWMAIDLGDRNEKGRLFLNK